MESVAEQLATHIPDLVIQRPHNAPLPQTVHSYGVIVFADISGFTALCEKYCSETTSKMYGTDQLTTTLNSYLSQIVHSILLAGGDILKFAGDALLAFWSCSRFTISGMLGYVLNESLTMQNDFDNFQTPDGVTLRMKLGLSIGRVDLHYIGNEDSRTFDVTGEAIDDANTAQNHTKSGAVVISKQAWDICNKKKCVATIVGPGYAQVTSFQITGIATPTSSDTTTTAGHQPKKRTFLEIAQMVVSSNTNTSIGSSIQGQRSNPWDEEDEKIASSGSVDRVKKSNLSLRPKLTGTLLLLSPEAQQVIRSYIIPTVLHKIDHGQDLNWLSELREVSVLFINMNPGLSLDAEGTLQLLQSSFDIVHVSLAKHYGTLNKLFMFDKGCTFLCIFGLPHVRHEHSVWNALRSAREIYEHLNCVDEIGYHSIGVTTGVAFCGVVGHPQRHEYTVIGQKVNMAARLMMKFPGNIMCDETTKAKSMFSNDQFTLAPPVSLKGIAKPENIYKFSIEHVESNHHHTWDEHMSTDADDLIDRQKEMKVFLDELGNVTEHRRRNSGILIITASGGMGKTKLIRAMKSKAAQMNFRVLSGSGGLIEQNTPFFTVKTLVTKLLKMDVCKNIHDREELLLSNINDPEMREKLPLLNDLLGLKLPQTPTTLEMVHFDQRTSGLHRLLLSIVHQEALSQPCVFGIDDAHWIDPDSWAFMLDLSLEPNAILVLTSCPFNRVEYKPPAMVDILHHPDTKVITLEGLSPKYMVELFCQKLEVDTIPKEIEEIIHKRSHGVPLWCEELVEIMLDLDYLDLIDRKAVLKDAQKKRWSKIKVQENDPSWAGRISLTQEKTNVSPATTSLLSEVEFGDIPIPDSVAGMVLARIDHMSATDQMTLKCAAIAGTTFKRTLLKAIIPNFNPHIFNQSLNVLADSGLLECAAAAQIKRGSTTTLGHEPLELHCTCLDRDGTLSPSRRSSNRLKLVSPISRKKSMCNRGSSIFLSAITVGGCETLQFVHNYIQETVYYLWTESQRRKLHEAAAHFLEKQAHRCKNCGEGPFVTGGNQSFLEGRKLPVGAGRPLIGRLIPVTTGVDQGHSSARETGTGPSLSTNSINNNNCNAKSFITGVESRQNQLAIEFEMKIGSHLDRIYASNTATMDVEMLECHCDEIISYVYPQLVRHWRAAGNMQNTIEYLVEAGAAAVVTGKNMEALSLLEEAKNVTEHGRSELISNMKHGRMYSLIGQTLFQMGQVRESVGWFHSALDKMSCSLPVGSVKGRFTLLGQCIKQYLHVKFPRRYINHVEDSEGFLDKARCMTHMVHAYHLMDKKLLSLMPALKLLNTAEEARCYCVHELIEAYSSVVECCQLLNYRRLANHYFNAAMTYCGNDVEFTLVDTQAYVHLLFVGFILKLYQGSYREALVIGTASYSLSVKMRNVSLKFATLPFLFFTNMACFNPTKSNDYLKQLSDTASEADDLRAQALYDCCHFDGLLDFGIDWHSENTLVTKAEESCKDNVYYYDEVERFFLISCLALWHARKGNTTSAKNYASTAEGLQPKVFDSYLAIRALSRYVECSLLLMQHFPSGVQAKNAKQALKKFKVAANNFRVFKSRYLLFLAYSKLIEGKYQVASKFLKSAYLEATENGSTYDMEWCLRHKKNWCGSSSDLDTHLKNNDSDVYMFIFQR